MFCSYFYYSSYLSELRISLQNPRNTDFTKKVANWRLDQILLKRKAYSKEHATQHPLVANHTKSQVTRDLMETG